MCICEGLRGLCTGSPCWWVCFSLSNGTGHRGVILIWINRVRLLFWLILLCIVWLLLGYGFIVMGSLSLIPSPIWLYCCSTLVMNIVWFESRLICFRYFYLWFTLLKYKIFDLKFVTFYSFEPNSFNSYFHSNPSLNKQQKNLFTIKKSSKH